MAAISSDILQQIAERVTRAGGRVKRFLTDDPILSPIPGKDEPTLRSLISDIVSPKTMQFGQQPSDGEKVILESTVPGRAASQGEIREFLKKKVGVGDISAAEPTVSAIEQRPEVRQAPTKKIVPTTPFDDKIEKVFGKNADNMKRVLRHTDEQGRVKGENTQFLTGREVDIPNRDGSIDRGLFRINSNTFADFQRRKPGLLKREGIRNYDDMINVDKNIKMARIIHDEQGFGAWFARPSDL